MSNKWFCSDHHYGHKNVIKLCNRPFNDLHSMHRTMTERHNEKVGKNDICFFVGDFAFANAKDTKKYLDQLNGRKILVAGNHDKMGDIGYMTAGFDLVLHRAQIKIAGKYVNLSHYPYLNNKAEQDDADSGGYKVKYADRRLVDDGNFLIHGHVHGAWKTRGRMINVGVDVWNFFPVSISEIESYIARYNPEDDYAEFMGRLQLGLEPPKYSEDL